MWSGAGASESIVSGRLPPEAVDRNRAPGNTIVTPLCGGRENEREREIKTTYLTIGENCGVVP